MPYLTELMVRLTKGASVHVYQCGHCKQLIPVGSKYYRLSSVGRKNGKVKKATMRFCSEPECKPEIKLGNG